MTRRPGDAKPQYSKDTEVAAHPVDDAVLKAVPAAHISMLRRPPVDAQAKKVAAEILKFVFTLAKDTLTSAATFESAVRRPCYTMPRDLAILMTMWTTSFPKKRCASVIMVLEYRNGTFWIELPNEFENLPWPSEHLCRYYAADS